MQNNGEQAPSQAKEFLKIDIGIGVITLMYYFLEQFKITEESHSPHAYMGIWWFFTFECLIQLAF